MTELRDRIAAVLASTVCTLAENNPCAECTEPELPVADLLIRELGLREEARDGAVVTDGFGTPISIRPPRHRYVTEWTTDA